MRSVLRVEVLQEGLGVMDLGAALNKVLSHLEIRANRVVLAEGDRAAIVVVIVIQGYVAVGVVLGVIQRTRPRT